MTTTEELETAFYNNDYLNEEEWIRVTQEIIMQ